MTQLFVIAILLAALGASGILGSLFKTARVTPSRRPVPVRRRPTPRPQSPRRQGARTVRRPPPARPNARSRAPRSAPQPAGAASNDVLLREVRPEETIVPRTQLHQLAARVERLESALGREAVAGQGAPPNPGTSSPPPSTHGRSLREQIFILMERGFGVDSVARQLRVSRAEVDLVLRMMALGERRPDFTQRDVQAAPTERPEARKEPAAHPGTRPVEILRHRVDNESLPVHSIHRRGVRT